LAVVHCPKCGVEIDLDEDEVEEGEIVTCVECEAELEIVQTHPVHLNIISEDDDDDDEEEADDDDADDDDDDDDDDDVEGDEEEEPA
jgi:lysine biosynthesis protein LysW